MLAKLRTKYPLNFVTLSNFLYTPGGEAILNDLAKVTVRSGSGGMQALRSSLVRAASSKEGLSIISFMQAYPSDRLEIDVEKAARAFHTLNLGYQQTQKFMKVMEAKTPNLFASNNPQLSQELSRKFSANIDPTQPGKANVEIVPLKLQDKKRFSRLVPVDIYVPKHITNYAPNSTITKTRKKPVVVLSHGFSSNKYDMRYLAMHLASHGYVVAAVEHTGSNLNYKLNWTRKDGITAFMQPQEFIHRPRDISFILDKLAVFNNQPNHQLSTQKIGQIDTENTTVIGHSFGASTALTIAGGELQIEDLKSRCPRLTTSASSSEWLQCLAKGLPENKYQLGDNRVKRVIAFNPLTSLMFGKTGLEKIKIPVLILTSSADIITPTLGDQVIGFNKITSPKWLVGIVGATHGSIKDPESTATRESKNTNEVVGEKVTDIRKYLRGISLAFIAQNDDPTYQAFLTPEYARYLSTQKFPIRLVREIPVDVMKVVNQVIQER